jgi:hypothetical protein
MARKRFEDRLIETAQDEDPTLLEELMAEPTPVSTIDGVLVGRVQEILPDGRVAFEAPGVAASPPARSLVDPETLAIGAEVALVFESGDPGRGIVVGKIFQGSESRRARVDDRELVLEAEREIVLRCGKASIRLTRDGRIVLRGVNLLSRAKVTNRIKGGSVQIN